MLAIRAGEVRPGKCFTGRNDGRVRRVVSVRDGNVTFELRKGKSGRQDWDSRAELPMDAFLSEAAKEVGCDFTA